MLLHTFLLGAALAAPPIHTKPAVANTPYESVEDWIRDLRKKDPAKRLLAARTIRTELRVAIRQSDKARAGSLLHTEALARLDDIQRDSVPACVDHVNNTDDPHPANARRVLLACADILGILRAEEALPALEQRTEQERGRVQRRLRRAARTIEGDK